jgi:FMN phosphatase YigB (HAD superfamily)
MTTFLELCEQYDGVGFDLDGTLYDEFLFISQFYHSLESVFLGDLKTGAKDYGCRTWLKFGSGYHFIFQDLYYNYYTGKMTELEFIRKCLFNYQNFKPNINLSESCISILELIKKKELFLVTDGNLNLQSNKVAALKLNKYICEENIFITGKLGKAFYKPSINVIKNSNIMKLPKVIFFGDRHVDEKFALNCEFDFQYVKNMKLLNYK